MFPGKKKEDGFEINISFYQSPDNIRKFAKVVRNIVELFWPKDKKAGFEVEVCMMEALTNVFLHAQNSTPHSQISFRLEKQSKKLLIRVFDEGKGFDLAEQLARKTDVFQTNGRGLFLMNSFMDSLSYTTGDDRNELILEKTISGSETE